MLSGWLKRCSMVRLPRQLIRFASSKYILTSRTPCQLLQLPPWIARGATFSSAGLVRGLTDEPNGQKHETKHNKGGLQLRPYQEECVQAVLEALKEGRRQIGISLATGSGKTVIFTELIDRVEDARKDATKTLILAHRRELVEQAARHCSSRYPDKSVEIEMGNMKASGLADITIASLQSINSQDRITKFDAQKFKLILVDEAHHIVASSYLRVLGHFGFHSDSESTSIPALVGVSATFSRHDGVALGKVIKHIVYHKDYIDMIDDNWLSQLIFTTVRSGVDLSKVHKGATGDFQTGSLSKAVNTPELNEVVVRSWLTRASNRKSTLVFCVDIQHIVDLTAVFRRRGIDARFVTGNTADVDRADTVEAFKRREFPVLLNCGVFTEGTDIPNIDCVLLCRPTRSRNLLVQMIGRGVRLYNQKENCHVIDMVASLEEGIVTTPTLFGLDPDEVVGEADVGQLRERKIERDAELRARSESASMPDDLRIGFTDYESVTDLIADTTGERHIRALSFNAWVSVSETKFVLLNGPEGSYIKIETKPIRGFKMDEKNEAKNPRYFVKVFRSPKSHPTHKTAIAQYRRPRQVAAAPTLESAVRAADTYAAEHFTRAFTLLRAPWRDADATQAQVDFLNNFCDSVEDERLRTSSLSKGQASDMISKVRHGAMTSWKEIMRARQRREKELERRSKLKAWQMDETVQVGPLSEDTNNTSGGVADAPWFGL